MKKKKNNNGSSDPENNSGYNNYGGYNGNQNPQDGYNNYGGYNGNQNPQGGYNNYGGYNGNQNPQGGYNNYGGYNGNQNPQGGYNNYGGYQTLDFSKRDPRIPEKLFVAHPDARIATKKDGMRLILIASLVLFIMLSIIMFFIILTEINKAETERIMNCNVTTEGIVTKTWKKTVSSSKSSRTTYYASYDYTYNGVKYSGKTAIQPGTLKEEEVVTVYVDPEDPSLSRLFHDTFFFHYFALLAVIPFAIVWIVSIKQYRLCLKGRMVIYNDPASKNKTRYRTVWKDISKFE